MAETGASANGLGLLGAGLGAERGLGAGAGFGAGLDEGGWVRRARGGAVGGAAGLAWQRGCSQRFFRTLRFPERRGGRVSTAWGEGRGGKRGGYTSSQT